MKILTKLNAFCVLLLSLMASALDLSRVVEVRSDRGWACGVIMKSEREKGAWILTAKHLYGSGLEIRPAYSRKYYEAEFIKSWEPDLMLLFARKLWSPKVYSIANRLPSIGAELSLVGIGSNWKAWIVLKGWFVGLLRSPLLGLTGPWLLFQSAARPGFSGGAVLWQEKIIGIISGPYDMLQYGIGRASCAVLLKEEIEKLTEGGEKDK